MSLPIVLFAVLAGLLVIWTVLVRTEFFTAERIAGTRPPPAPRQPPEAAQALHARLTIVDLHADSLIWRRDLLRRSSLGHFDFPRMADAGGALQGFLVVTEAPREVIGGGLADKSDRLTTVGIVDQWPLRAIVDQTERALYLGGKLARVCERSNGRVRLVLDREGLARLLDDRARDPNLRGVFLGLEGADGTKFELRAFERLHAAGFRLMELCHYTDTPFAGSSSGVGLGGLTPLGREAIMEMDRLGLLVDLAHASPRTVEDVLAHSSRAPFFTHVGSAGCHHDPKCLPDELLMEVVRRGGVVGLGFVTDYVGGTGVSHVVRALVHMVRRLGPQGVALGSGFCALPGPLAVDHLPTLTAELLAAGLDEAEIAGVMGTNAIRYLLSALPPASALQQQASSGAVSSAHDPIGTSRSRAGGGPLKLFHTL